MLIEERQGHLFSGWPGLGVADSDKRKFFCQVGTLDPHDFACVLAAQVN